MREDASQIDRADSALLFVLARTAVIVCGPTSSHDRCALLNSVALARVSIFVAQSRLLQLRVSAFSKALVLHTHTHPFFSLSIPSARYRSIIKTRAMLACALLQLVVKSKHLVTSELSSAGVWDEIEIETEGSAWSANLSEIDLCFREIGDDILVVARQRQRKSPTSGTTKATRLRGSERSRGAQRGRTGRGKGWAASAAVSPFRSGPTHERAQTSCLSSGAVLCRIVGEGGMERGWRPAESGDYLRVRG